ncbi:MAG: hypothetical protein U9Q66_01530 [Patescibacteria group bacterium]|nr:hypothetical protein [Patescibacteria group bacterium]
MIFFFNIVDITQATVVPVNNDGNNHGLVVTQIYSISSRVNLVSSSTLSSTPKITFACSLAATSGTTQPVRLCILI